MKNPLIAILTDLWGWAKGLTIFQGIDKTNDPVDWMLERSFDESIKRPSLTLNDFDYVRRSPLQPGSPDEAYSQYNIHELRYVEDTARALFLAAYTYNGKAAFIDIPALGVPEVYELFREYLSGSDINWELGNL